MLFFLLVLKNLNTFSSSQDHIDLLNASLFKKETNYNAAEFLRSGILCQHKN